MMLRFSFILLPTFIIAFAITFAAAFVIAQDADKPKPLYEDLPFNRITLTKTAGGEQFNVKPIEIPPGSTSERLPRSGKLTVKFIDREGKTDKEYEVEWRKIGNDETFPDLVQSEFLEKLDVLLEQVDSLTSKDVKWTDLATSFDELFEYLRFLKNFTDLKTYPLSLQKFLFAEGKYRVKSKDILTGLVRFEMIYDQNKRFPDLDKAWAETLSTAMKKEEEQPKFVHFLLRCFQAYPENETVITLMERYIEKPRLTFAKSKESFAKKELTAAHIQCQEATEILAGFNTLPQWYKTYRESGRTPSEKLAAFMSKMTADIKGMNEWKTKLFQIAPRVDIAVGSPISDKETGEFSLPSWSARRGQRILSQMLCLYDHPSLDGGVYASTVGSVEKIQGGVKFTFPKDQQDKLKFGVSDIIDTIFPKDGESPAAEAEVVSAEQLEVRLQRPCLIPEALFNVPIANQHGGYFWKDKSDKENVFQLQSSEISETIKRTYPAVILEHTVQRSEEAVEQLVNGKVDFIDRLAPWVVKGLRTKSDIVVGRYAVPSVYFLVPNGKKPLTASRTFRRAMIYGLNRDKMLAKILENGGQGTVLSAPFPKGVSLTDPIGYAYETMIDPRPYEPKLGIALSLLAFDQIRNNTPGWKEKNKIPEMVLARPKNEISEFIAMMIQRQWQAIGLTVKVVEYRENEPIGKDENIDFWLVDRMIQEPLVDAEKIFGQSGLTQSSSPYMDLALEKLRYAVDWPAASRELHHIHRLCFDETAVIPLWQLSEFYAHRAGISGVASQEGVPDLYRNILHWTMLKR
jgi:hypothetical protein